MLKLNREQVKRIVYGTTKSYTYGLCLDDGTLFYVGVGVSGRIFRHEWEVDTEYASNHLKSSVIKKQKNISYVIFLISDKDSCLKLESQLISHFGCRWDNSGILTNLTLGGESGPRGYKLTPEQLEYKKERMRACADKISATLKERYANLTIEEQNEIVSRLDGHRNNAISREKLGKKSKERWSDPLYRERVRETHRKNWENPEYREKVLAARGLNKSKTQPTNTK